MFENTAELRPQAPFDLGQSLAFLRGFPLTRGDQTITDDAVTRAVVAGGETVVFRVVEQGTTDAPSLGVTLYAERPISDAVREAALDRVAFFLSIADDLTPYYAIGREDAAFAPVIAQLYGYHQVKFLTPFDNAAWAILSQRTPMAAARKTWNALIDRYGSSLTADGTTYRAFPTAERLATVNPDDLSAILPNLRKAHYLHAAARAFDDVDEQWLRSAPYDEVNDWLRRIPGIGEWSATFVLIRALGRMAGISSEDALLRAAAKVYGPQAGTPDGLRAIARRYGDHQGYWAHYLRAFA
ncbi:MAG: DNA-3-methyladenine glycosylase family protein [Thermomicrobiales bacterium]